MPYRHAGDLRYMRDQVIGSPYRYEPSLLQRIGQFAKAVVQIVKSQSILGIEDRQLGKYCRKLNAQMRLSPRDPSEGSQSQFS
jgi:hypothetical protein